MNDDLRNNQPPNDEVDLGQLFNAIGRVFDRFFRFIGSIFKAVLSFLVFILKVVIDNFKLIGVVVIVSFIIGLTLQKLKPTVYTSQMLVKPYFDSKYQLVNNIDYYNTLIKTKDYKGLSEVFGIPEETTKELKLFEVLPGPESENEKLWRYDLFKKELDTASARTYTYKEYLDNRNIYSGDLFEVNVESTKKDIFKSLETGMNKTFRNTYSERQKEKRDILLDIQTSNIMASLTSIDSLRKVYITVLKNDSNKGSSTISFGEGLSLDPDKKSKTKEFELLEREIEFRNKLAQLEEVRLEEDTYFDVVSSFQSVGNKTNKIDEKYTLLFPFVSFLILTVLFMIIRIVKYVRQYEK